MSNRQYVTKSLEALAANAKAGGMSIKDWAWFFRFVVATRSSRIQWCASEVQQLLADRGVEESQAERLGQLYGYCRAAIYCAGKNQGKAWYQFLE
jgi:hypothetical protein